MEPIPKLVLNELSKFIENKKIDQFSSIGFKIYFIMDDASIEINFKQKYKYIVKLIYKNDCLYWNLIYQDKNYYFDINSGLEAALNKIEKLRCN